MKFSWLNKDLYTMVPCRNNEDIQTLTNKYVSGVPEGQPKIPHMCDVAILGFVLKLIVEEQIWNVLQYSITTWHRIYHKNNSTL